MTTAQLIELLKQEDPEGTAEVCVGVNPVWFVEKVPAYYDGRLEFVERVKGLPVRAGWRDNGLKVKIHTDDIETAIYDNPEVEIVEPLRSDGRHTAWVESKRKEARDLKAELRKSLDLPARPSVLPSPTPPTNQPKTAPLGD